MNIFGSDLFGYDLILFGLGFKFQDPLVMLVVGLINLGMTNQVPQVFFKLATRDLMLASSYEADIVFCESLVTFEAISDYGAQAFTPQSPRASLPFYLITCLSHHRTSKDGDVLHSPGHLLLTLGADFTSHGLMFKDAIYQLLEISSNGSNSQELFLSHQLISVALHGSSFHLAAVYVPDSVGNFLLLPKRKIPPDIIISLERFTCTAS